jgi:hypothetical protein
VDAVDDFDAALDWVQAHDTCDLARKAVVEGGGPLLPRAPQSTCSECCEVNDAVTWLHRSPNHLRLEAELDRPGFLVLSQVWYADWRAEVDGQPARLWKTDAVLSGLYLVPGKHVVSLDYCPVWTWIGGGVSLAALIAVCLVGFGRKRKQCRTINDDKRQRGAV